MYNQENIILFTDQEIESVLDRYELLKSLDSSRFQQFYEEMLDRVPDETLKRAATLAVVGTILFSGIKDINSIEGSNSSVAGNATIDHVVKDPNETIALEAKKFKTTPEAIINASKGLLPIGNTNNPNALLNRGQNILVPTSNQSQTPVFAHKPSSPPISNKIHKPSKVESTKIPRATLAPEPSRSTTSTTIPTKETPTTSVPAPAQTNTSQNSSIEAYPGYFIPAENTPRGYEQWNVSSNVLGASGFSAQDYNLILQGTALEGEGQAVYNVEQQFGINGLFIISHQSVESAWGTSQFAKERNNYFGIGAFTSDPNNAYYYASPEACLNAYATLLKNNYLTPGGMYYTGTSVHDIFNHYSTSDSLANELAGIAEDETIVSRINKFLEILQSDGVPNPAAPLVTETTPSTTIPAPSSPISAPLTNRARPRGKIPQPIKISKNNLNK